MMYYMVCRHSRPPFWSCMLTVEEGDPVPTMDEIEEAERFQEAINAGDPAVELVPWDQRPGVLLAFWKDSAERAA